MKLAWEAAIFRHLTCPRMTPLRRSALLMSGELSSVTLARLRLGVLGGVVMPAFILAKHRRRVQPAAQLRSLPPDGPAVRRLPGGELLERYLFFAAVRRTANAGRNSLMTIAERSLTPSAWIVARRSSATGR